MVSNTIGSKASCGLTTTPTAGSLVALLYNLPFVVKVFISGVYSSTNFLTALASSINDFTSSTPLAAANLDKIVLPAGDCKNCLPAAINVSLSDFFSSAIL